MQLWLLNIQNIISKGEMFMKLKTGNLNNVESKFIAVFRYFKKSRIL